MLISLQQIINQLKLWEKKIKTDPLWYETVMPTVLDWNKNLPEGDLAVEIKTFISNFFSEKLQKGEIFIAQSGPDFDQWRAPIDTVVIHYTGGSGGHSWQSLSTTGFLRQYATDFTIYDDVYGIPTRGTPIWSGHFRGETQVFYAYHWLVKRDGTVERLLEDKYIGWQAGNGDINFRSIAIVLDGEYVDISPPSEMINAIIQILKKHYPNIKSERIFGHREINPKTLCPGNMFIPEWKEKVITNIK